MANDFEEKLFENGIVWVHSHISNDEQDLLSPIILNLLAYRDQPDKLIQLFVTSSSEDYTSSFAVYDVLQSIPNPVAGFGMGGIDYYGTLLLAACKKGKRYALKNTTIGIHQPVGFFVGTTLQTDAVITANEATANRKVFEELLAKHTGQPLEKIHADVSLGLELTPEEAVAYGIIDHVLE